MGQLECARDCLVEFYHVYQFKMRPAVHYMLKSFLEDVEHMRPAYPYHWICEGNEAFHKRLRKLGNLVFFNGQYTHDPLTPSDTEIILQNAILVSLLKNYDARATPRE